MYLNFYKCDIFISTSQAHTPLILQLPRNPTAYFDLCGPNHDHVEETYDDVVGYSSKRYDADRNECIKT